VLVKELRKREADMCQNSQGRIKIEEKTGIEIKDILVPNNPLKKSKCVEKNMPAM
jgi:hypothetical protein